MTHDLVLLGFAIALALLGVAAVLVPARYVEDRFMRWATAIPAWALALLIGLAR